VDRDVERLEIPVAGSGKEGGHHFPLASQNGWRSPGAAFTGKLGSTNPYTIRSCSMPEGIGLFVYPVKDLAQATALYTAMLRVAPYAESPYYVGFRVGDQEIGLDPNGHAKGQTGPIGYWPVSDIKQSLQQLVEAGAQVHQDVQDVGGGKLIAWVKDADGNLTGLMQSA
jgi:predicted enzyme related to lactoylglutathione lyase